MTKKLMLGAALSALMVSGAFAQSTPPKPGTPPPTPPAAASTPAPAAANQANKAEDQANKAKDEANKAKDQANKAQDQAKKESTSAQPQFVAEQKPDQFLASKFNGKDVMGSNGKKIGSIGDILFDKDGKIEAYVVSTGGFLGIGAKEVALPPSAFQVVPDTKGGSDKLKISMSEQQLKDAQKFTEYKKPQPVTTGAAGGAAPGPMGGAHPPGGGMR